MSFIVRILGSGAALPTGKRNPSAQYIQCNNRHILIDCGEGTQHQIRKFGIKIQSIKHIFISHLHGDHYYGLIGLLSTMNLLGRDKDITVYAPKELKQIIELQTAIGGNKFTFNISFVELKGKEKKVIFEDKLLKISSFPLKHRIETYGFIIEEKDKPFSIDGEAIKKDNISLRAIPFFREGKDFYDDDKNLSFKAENYTLNKKKSFAYAYCSDSAYFDEICKHIEDVDALYHEATFLDYHSDKAHATFHSTAKQAAKIALKSKAKSLILGHFSSRYENANQHVKEAKEIFSNVTAAEDGMEIVIYK